MLTQCLTTADTRQSIQYKASTARISRFRATHDAISAVRMAHSPTYALPAFFTPLWYTFLCLYLRCADYPHQKPPLRYGPHLHDLCMQRSPPGHRRTFCRGSSRPVLTWLPPLHCCFAAIPDIGTHSKTPATTTNIVAMFYIFWTQIPQLNSALSPFSGHTRRSSQCNARTPLFHVSAGHCRLVSFQRVE